MAATALAAAEARYCALSNEYIAAEAAHPLTDALRTTAALPDTEGTRAVYKRQLRKRAKALETLAGAVARAKREVVRLRANEPESPWGMRMRYGVAFGLIALMPLIPLAVVYVAVSANLQHASSDPDVLEVAFLGYYRMMQENVVGPLGAVVWPQPGLSRGAALLAAATAWPVLAYVALCGLVEWTIVYFHLYRLRTRISKAQIVAEMGAALKGDALTGD